MSKQKLVKFSRRMGEPARAGEDVNAALQRAADRQTIVTTVRRFGYVATKVHQVIMEKLIQEGDQGLAERFNDVFKPMVDMLLHFELDDTLERESDDQKGDASGL